MIYENVCMITSLPTKRISAISQWKTFLRVLPTRWRRKPAGIETTSLSPYVYRVYLLTGRKQIRHAYSVAQKGGRSPVKWSGQHLRRSTCRGEIFLSLEFGTKFQRKVLYFENIRIFRQYAVWKIGAEASVLKPSWSVHPFGQNICVWQTDINMVVACTTAA